MRGNLGVLGVRRCAFILLLVASDLLVGSLRAFAQTSDNRGAASTDSQPVFQLKVSSNLVVVRVVVRDAQGKPVEGLRKEDFKLFDRGKEQSISQFEVEAPTAPPSTSAVVGTPGEAAKTTPPVMPNNFLALYFDDLNTSDVDMIYVREAADHYLAANLQTRDRVAIFTSDQMLSDFTVDPQQVRTALAKLQASARSLTRAHNCPDLSDYQATEISQQNPEYSEAWQMALDEAINRCKLLATNQDSDAGLQGGDSPASANPTTQSSTSSKADTQLDTMIRMMATHIVSQVELQARSNLEQLDHLVTYLSQMPGQRTIILVSPGFLSQSEQYELNRIVDHAVRAQVVISSLDPRGLAPPRESEASRSYIAGRSGAAERLDSKRELVAADVLEEFAQDTGGEFFHNNNDLKVGFGALAGSPVYYMLAFAPTGMKPDGKFHALNVDLTEKRKGLSVQARRGYFAPKNEAEAEADAKRQAASDSEAQAREQIREALFSKTDSRQLPVQLGGQLSEVQGGKRELALATHLDATPLHFQKDGEHNLNTVTFIFAVFDERDHLITSQQRQAFVKVLDTQLPELFKEGVDMSMNFQLKPGVYRIREVVTDSEEHHLTALSTTIKVP
jgi:VWFA-related protein